jgi:hypothetical protein
MILTLFTIFHVAISLVGLLAGFVAVYGLLRGRLLSGWTTTFLSMTVATSVTGFFFPRAHIMPAHIVGIVSLLGLAVAVYALYSRSLQGAWRNVYVVSAVFSLYLNMFVGVVQAFQKIPILKAAAPTQSEPPFAVAQGAVLILFVAAGWLAWINFRAFRLTMRSPKGMPQPIISPSGAGH